MATGTEHLSPETLSLLAFLEQRKVDCELLRPGLPMPTVPLAAAAIGVSEDQIIKSVLFKGRAGELVLAIACGTARIDRSSLEAIFGIAKLKLADAETVLAATGFPAGGVAPVGHSTALAVIVDQRVMNQPVVFGGGGAEDLLLRIRPDDIVRMTSASIALITSLPEPPVASASDGGQ